MFVSESGREIYRWIEAQEDMSMVEGVEDEQRACGFLWGSAQTNRGRDRRLGSLASDEH